MALQLAQYQPVTSSSPARHQAVAGPILKFYTPLPGYYHAVKIFFWLNFPPRATLTAADRDRASAVGMHTDSRLHQVTFFRVKMVLKSRIIGTAASCRVLWSNQKGMDDLKCACK